MKFTIKHELKNRMRVHLAAKKMTFEQADLFQYYLQLLHCEDKVP